MTGSWTVPSPPGKLSLMLLLAAQAASVTIRAVDGDSGEPIFARVALRDEPGALGGAFRRTSSGASAPARGRS